MTNWNEILTNLNSEVKSFARCELSGEKLYAKAVAKGIGPLVRPLIRQGVTRSRKAAKEALRRRST